MGHIASQGGSQRCDRLRKGCTEIVTVWLLLKACVGVARCTRWAVSSNNYYIPKVTNSTEISKTQEQLGSSKEFLCATEISSDAPQRNLDFILLARGTFEDV